MRGKGTRHHIVEAADLLFYQRGFEHTSFAHIADVVKISRGNFYHYFKSKDEILEAVIDLRLANTQKMLEQWERKNPQPVERIRCFIRILITNWSKIRLYGCPVGTLSTELAKLHHASRPEAARIFTLFKTWLEKQFALMGHKDADELALHVLACSQGVATVANAFDDEKFMRGQVEQMLNWLDSLSKKSNTKRVKK